MVVIFGFDLSEMRWDAFSHKKMFDKRWHLRRERFVVYQIAMLTGLAAECTATYSLAKYRSHEELSKYVQNHDILAAAYVTIVSCVLVATLFGADFFFLVFWPRRMYPPWYNATKEALAVGITLGMAVSCWMTTVVVATHAAHITDVDFAAVQTLLYNHPPLVYHKFPQNVAWVVLLWIAFLSTVAATAIMFISTAHDTKYGTAARDSEEVQSDAKQPRDTEVSPVA